jgi:hypothetical protein
MCQKKMMLKCRVMNAHQGLYEVFQQSYGENIMGKSLMDKFCWFFINAKWVGFRCVSQ